MSLIFLVFVINTKIKGTKLTKEDSMKKLSACPDACDADFLKLQYLSSCYLPPHSYLEKDNSLDPRV